MVRIWWSNPFPPAHSESPCKKQPGSVRAKEQKVSILYNLLNVLSFWSQSNLAGLGSLSWLRARIAELPSSCLQHTGTDQASSSHFSSGVCVTSCAPHSSLQHVSFHKHLAVLLPAHSHLSLDQKPTEKHQWDWQPCLGVTEPVGQHPALSCRNPDCFCAPHIHSRMQISHVLSIPCTRQRT